MVLGILVLLEPASQTEPESNIWKRNGSFGFYLTGMSVRQATTLSSTNQRRLNTSQRKKIRRWRLDLVFTKKCSSEFHPFRKPPCSATATMRTSTSNAAFPRRVLGSTRIWSPPKWWKQWEHRFTGKSECRSDSRSSFFTPADKKRKVKFSLGQRDAREIHDMGCICSQEVSP